MILPFLPAQPSTWLAPFPGRASAQNVTCSVTPSSITVFKTPNPLLLLPSLSFSTALTIL